MGGMSRQAFGQRGEIKAGAAGEDRDLAQRARLGQRAARILLIAAHRIELARRTWP